MAAGDRIMIKLPQVTLCALGSVRYKNAQQRALDYSSREIEFGAVKNIIHPHCNDIDEWNKAIIYDLASYITTDFLMLIHPDGYIVNPSVWRDEWLNFDYIGVPWPMPSDDYSYRAADGELIRVGNSVSLRSAKLVNLAPSLGLEWKPFHGYSNEDGFICVNYRHEYLKAGMKFAPIEVAKYFSREEDMPENADVEKPFAFHMHNNFPKRGRNAQYEVFE